MPKSPAERKAAQRTRQFVSGERKFELVLDEKIGWDGRLAKEVSCLRSPSRYRSAQISCCRRLAAKRDK
ncbi:hypothetical protein [Klebsiella michiganensis]|uniref:hypothetical protein n=1 Tax=Klebsiella michiganensis TaxID=1134687 RepID=UPI003B985339